MQQFVTLTVNGIILGSVFAAFALTLVLIYRATRIINFGQGAMAMFSAYLALETIKRTDSYWLGFVVALASGFIIGGVVERVIVRRVETGPELNAVIVTLGVFVSFVALASILFGNTIEGFPAPFSVRGFEAVAITPTDIFKLIAVLIAMSLLLVLFRFTSLGLQMRAAAFGQEVARLLGVRVGQMLTLGWALAGMFGALAGVLIASGAPISPTYMDAVVVFGFVAAVLGGLDSFLGAVVGGLVLGLTNTYVAGYVERGSALVTLAALAILITVLLLRPSGLFSSSVARKV
ncbi:branched-chain amino acid ABC transporter permease [soil metagenome]